MGDSLKLLKQMYKVSDEMYERNYALFQKFPDIESIQGQPVRQLSLGQRIIIIDNGTVVIDTQMDQLQKRYGKNAIVTLTTREPVAEIAIDGATLKEHDEHKLVFEIEKAVMTPGQLMHKVSEIVDVEDIDIKENSVEDIIHDIYLHEFCITVGRYSS